MRVIVASLALHLTLLWVLPKGQAIAYREAPVEVAIEFIAPEPQEATRETTPNAPAIPSANRTPNANRAEHSSVNPQTSEAAPSLSLPGIETTPTTPSSPTVPAFLLDPSRVAAQHVFGTESMPASGSHGNLREDNGPTIGETLRRLEGEMHAEAVTKTYTQRTRANLRRRGDGSYFYQGHAFAATITPDGEVRFSDRGGFEVDPAAGQARFDLMDTVMRANGQDPYAAERQWFMDQTETLREQLEDAALVRQRTEGLRRIRGRLSGIWNHTERTPDTRRRQIFEIWTEMAEGEEGAAGRNAVLEWIREVLPQEDDDAFTASEIATFNRGRIVRFVPYP